MTRSYSMTRCTRCGHTEKRYANVKRCRECHGPLERPPAREDLMRRIVERAWLWASHDDVLRALLREWEGL